MPVVEDARHAVASTHAELREPAREPGRALAQLAVGEPKLAFHERLRVRVTLGGRQQGEREVHAALSGRAEDRLDDRLVARAAAQVAGEHLGDLLAARVRDTFQIVLRRHQDPGRAEAALKSVLRPERGLKRCQVAVAGEPFDRLDLGPVDLDREEEARPDSGPVEAHGAGAADAVLAADVRAVQAERVAQEVREEEPRLDLLRGSGGR